MRTFVASTLLAAFVATPALSSELMLYTSQPNKDAQQTVDAFMAANPDIKVSWVRDGTTKVMAKLKAEIAADDIRPDVLLIADTVTLESLKQEGRLQPYQSAFAKGFDSALYDAEGFYYSTKLITSGIVYNTGVKDKPTSWQDLTKADMKGMIAMPSPLYSGAALIHLATLTGNEQLGWDYYEALAKNDARAKGGNGGTFKAVASGEKPYGVVVDFLAIRNKAKALRLTLSFPKKVFPTLPNRLPFSRPQRMLKPLISSSISCCPTPASSWFWIRVISRPNPTWLCLPASRLVSRSS